MITKPGFLSKVKGVFARRKDTATDVSDGVISSLEDQLKQTPNNFRLRLKLADTCMARGEREKALEEYSKVARLYLEHDFTPLAVATFKKILTEEPQHLEANLELGRIYRQKKFYADATSYFHKVFDYYRENALDDKALQILETIIEIVPDKEPYRLLLKEHFPDHQESAKSIYSDIIIAHKKTSPEPDLLPKEDDEFDMFFDLGAELGDEIEEIEACPTTGSDTDDAKEDPESHGVEEIFQTLRSTFHEETDNPDSDKFHYNLAFAYSELNMPEQALRESEEVLKSANFRLSTLLLRSQIFLSQGLPSDALSQIQQGLLEKGLTRPDFLTFKIQLGLILRDMGHYPQALDALHEAYSLNPENEELAREIYALENSTEAIE